MSDPTVLHVITGLGDGGAEAFLSRLVTAPRERPVQAVVVSLTDGGRYGPLLTDAGIRVETLGLARGRVPGPVTLHRLARLIRETAPVAIQSWMYHADLVALAGLLASGRQRSTRLFWGIRASNLDTRAYGVMLRLVIGLSARFSGWPDAVVANAEAGRQAHVALGYRPRRFLVIPNGVDRARFRPLPERKAALRQRFGIPLDAVAAILPARIDPQKDHATFLAALSRLPGVLGIACGQGTEALHPTPPNLLRLGPVAEMPELLAACDIVVSSSAFGEGFSNALAEGMAAGLPAVATDVGDAGAIVGEAGRIVPPRDPVALQCALTELAEDHGLRTSLGARARARSAQFSLDRAVAAFDRLHLGELRDGSA